MSADDTAGSNFWGWSSQGLLNGVETVVSTMLTKTRLPSPAVIASNNNNNTFRDDGNTSTGTGQEHFYQSQTSQYHNSTNIHNIPSLATGQSSSTGNKLIYGTNVVNEKLTVLTSSLTSIKTSSGQYIQRNILKRWLSSPSSSDGASLA